MVVALFFSETVWCLLNLVIGVYASKLLTFFILGFCCVAQGSLALCS